MRASSAERPQQSPQAQGVEGASDWEPQAEEEWEGVPPVDVVPSQGSRLVERYGQVLTACRRFGTL